MNSTLSWLLAGAAGAGLGAIFYGGLWWTVRRGVTARQPALWFIGSLFLRLALVTTGFFLVGGGQLPRLLACLLGFIIARVVVLRLTAKPEGSHAP